MSRNKTQPMYKVVENETITLYLSQFVILLLVAACSVLPIFYELPVLSGRNAVIGLIITVTISTFDIWIVVKLFWGDYAYSIYRYINDLMSQIFFDIDIALEDGVYTEETTENKKELFRKTLNAFINYSSLSFYFMLFNCAMILLMVGAIIYTQIVNHKFLFYYLYGIGDFFLMISIPCLYISSKFIYSAEQTWLRRFEERIENDFKKEKDDKEKEKYLN